MPSDCQDGTVISPLAADIRGHDIEGLSPQTKYSFLVCVLGQPQGRSIISATLANFDRSPVYSGNSNWNDYVRNDNVTKYSASNTTCDGTETNNLLEKICIHGAEIQKVDAPSLEGNCSGVSAEDSLGLFNWICDDSLGHPTFYSVGLKQEKSLSDALTATSFKPNRIVISMGSKKVGSTKSEIWWNNPIASPSSTSMTLSSSGTIYVLSENRVTSGYTIAANKIGFVILPGFALTSNLNTTLILSSGTKFNWVEGSFGESSATSIVSFQSSYSQMRNVSIEDQNATTGLLVSSNYNVLKKLGSREQWGLV